MQVCVGTGGTAKDYPVMNSTKASLEYGDKEGQGILDEQTLGKLNDKNWGRDNIFTCIKRPNKSYSIHTYM